VLRAPRRAGTVPLLVRLRGHQARAVVIVTKTKKKKKS
jgi:hypothetical protein